MYPVILKLGPITIYSYGLMLALAFILATYLAQRRARVEGILVPYRVPPQKIVDLVLYLLVFGIIGGRLFYVLANLDYYLKDPLEIVMIHHGGLAIYGGIIFSSLAGIRFLAKNKLPVFKTADLIIPYVALGQAIGRIGCFLNGCCYGKPIPYRAQATSVLGVYFPNIPYPVHPTQIYSSLSMLALFVILRFLQKFNLKQGCLFLLYLLLYAAIRFCLDFFRGDIPVLILGLTIYQIISIIIFVIILPILIIRCARLNLT